MKYLLGNIFYDKCTTLCVNFVIALRKSITSKKSFIYDQNEHRKTPVILKTIFP